MMGAKSPGGAVRRPERPVGNVFKKQVIQVPFRPVGNNPAEGAARFGGGLFQLKKIDMPFHPSAPNLHGPVGMAHKNPGGKAGEKAVFHDTGDTV